MAAPMRLAPPVTSVTSPRSLMTGTPRPAGLKGRWSRERGSWASGPQPVDLRGQHEVVARQAFDGVRGQLHAQVLVAREVEVGVVLLRLGHVADVVGEGER